MSEALSRLRKLDIFNNLDDKEFNFIISKLNRRVLKKDTIICDEGDSGDDMFLLFEGNIKISKTVAGKYEETLAEIEAPSVFGMVSLVDGSERSAKCLATTDVTLLTLKKTDFDIMLAKSDVVANKVLFNITKSMSSQLRMANQKLADLYSNPLDTIEKLKNAYKSILKNLE
ncbi:MAG: cyclic nucleotide-binding domain-containing protein [Pseudomonadota bacterium]